MKELSIEDKAKAYDKAVYKMGYLLDRKDLTAEEMRENIECIFPELAESEDEKIRKNLTAFLLAHKDNKRPIVTPTDNQIDTWIAYIEKQGEQKLITHKYNVGATIYYNSFGETKSMLVANVVDNGDGNPMYEDANGNAVFEKDLVEQKPVDKVEPKFHKGDWVVFNNKHQSIYQVEKIEDGYYILRHTHGGTFRVCVLHDEGLRLWTFQDAKDGDVLSYRDGQWIFIYKGFGKEENEIAYYALLSDEGLTLNNYNYSVLESAFSPATKEERDTLEKAMSDAGYIFNFEKKELRKIGQNPAWSEEDEINLKYTTRIIERLYDKQENNYLKESLERKLN